MTDTTYPPYRSLPGPLHALVLGSTFPLFLGGLLSDIAYYNTYLIQWSNFASWLIAGGMVFCGLALLFALVNLLRAHPKSGRPTVYFLLLLITWAVGWINSFQHAKDAWAVMPSGLTLSVILTLLSLASAWTGLTHARTGGTR